MTALLLVLLLLLVAINGFFVAAEFALVRSRRGKLEQLAEEGESGAEEVIGQLDKIDESLSSCQIGITMEVYSHVYSGAQDAVAATMDALFPDAMHLD